MKPRIIEWKIPYSDLKDMLKCVEIIVSFAQEGLGMGESSTKGFKCYTNDGTLIIRLINPSSRNAFIFAFYMEYLLAEPEIELCNDKESKILIALHKGLLP